MKKNGFTLAEVLITLAIIGVVATLTLPTLMSNTQEQQAVTGFRKAMNTLNEVAQMNAAVDGFDYSSITTAHEPGDDPTYDNGVLEQSLYSMIASKAKVNKAASGTAIGGDCDGLQTIFFLDGTVLCYPGDATTESADDTIEAVVDTNGIKAPNRLSSCGNAQCTENKDIADQFNIVLQGSAAYPAEDDNAATWAMSK